MIDAKVTRTALGLILLGLAAAVAVSAEDTEPAAPENGISGRVTDAAGEPLAGATVWVRAKDHTAGRKAALGEKWVGPVSVETDDDGVFSVALPVDGPYIVLATHPAHPPFALNETVDDGSDIELSFPLPIAHTGTVRDERGEPVEGADVTACGRYAATFGAFACLHARSDEDGRVSFDRLAEGTYGFQAWAPGYALRVLRGESFPLEDDAEGPQFILEPGAEVSGSVVDDAGTPLAGVVVHYSTDRVRLGQARGRRDVLPLLPSITDEEGRFSTRGLPSGEPLKMSASVAKNRPAESKTLTLEPGAVVGGIRIVYNRPATVTVHLIDPDEQPIDSLEVLWMPVKEGAKKSGGGFRMAGYAGRTQVEARGEGRFVISEIKPRRYDLTLLPEGYREIEIEDLLVPAAGEIDLGTRVAQRGSTLTGTVRDDLGDPVDGAKVEGMFLNEGTAMSRSVKSRPDGRFVLGGLAQAPLLWLKTTAKGYATRNERGVETDQTDYEIVLERVGKVTGRVALESGEPPLDVTATLEPESGGRTAFRRGGQAAAQGDEEGRFEIPQATPGTHHLRLTAKGAMPRRIKDVVVLAGETTDVGMYRLVAGRELSGTVLDAGSGAPIVNAAISADAARGGLVGTAANLGATTTDDEGRFTVEGLEPGSLVLTAKHPDYAAEKVEVVLKENEPADELTLHLGQGGTLRGTVRDESGRPAPERSLGLIAGGGFTPEDGVVRTNDAGEYRVERVRPGTYRVMLFPDPSGNAMDIRQKSATIRSGEETVVDFDDEAKIVFEGLLTRGGRPVGEVTVMLVPDTGGGMMQTRTASVDIGGRFELSLSRPGKYNVIVQDLEQGLGTLVGQASIVVPDEPNVSQEIVLQAGRILGTVLDASGEPVEGAVISAMLEGARPGDIGGSTGARVEADGSFRIEGANDGTYTLSAMADGYQVATRSVTVTGSSTVDGIDFRLEPAAELRGRVVDEHGNGVSGALVFATLAGAPASSGMPGETDSEGFFRLSAPSDGPCDLEAVARGFAPGALRGFVPPADADAPGARITLTRGATITIRIVDAEGLGVDGAQPAVLPERPSQAFTVAMLFSPIPPTNASGTTRVSGLSPGAYSVSVAGNPGVAAQTVTVTEGGDSTLTLHLP